MGLLDGVLGNVLGGMLGGGASQQASNPLMQVAFQLLQQNGGIPGVLDMLKKGGLGAQADSWVSTGQNLPVSGDQLLKVLGPALGNLGGGAGGLGGALGGLLGGGAQQQANLGGLADLLPGLIDKMTPHGSVPDNHGDLVSQGLAMLMKRGLG